jgi:signal transduction histidine kinase
MEAGKPRFISKPIWLRFVAAFLFVMAALAVTSGLWLIVDRPISSVLFLVAIVLSSWFCGFRAGLFATILSGLLLDYFFLAPTYEILADRNEVVRFVLFMIEGSIISWLLDAQRIATDEISHSREQLQALTNHLQNVRESEQKRIALEIHDELGQALTGVKMGVHWLSRQIAEKNGDLKSHDISAKLDELLKTIDSTVSSIRRIATELRPSILDDFGLIAAIEWQIKEFERMSGIPCDFRTDVSELEIDPEISTAVFRIFQEALTNIVRHANASTVDIVLSIENDGLSLTVIDDGIGIKPDELRNKRSLGILGMKERAKLVGGTFEISPRGSVGAEVKLKVPLLSKGVIVNAAA